MSFPPVTRELKRPLPPPQSREAVLAEIEGVESWTLLDDSDDIQVCMPCKRMRLNSESARQVAQSSLLSMQFVPGSYSGTACLHRAEAQPYARPGPSNIPKRRLFSSHNGTRNHTESRGLELHPFTSEAYRREGVRAEARSEATTKGYRPCDNDEKDQEISDSSQEDGREEAIRLARYSHWSFGMLDHDSTEIETSPTENTEIFLANKAREKLELAGQERSRRLREQALARRERHEAVPQSLPPDVSDRSEVDGDTEFTDPTLDTVEERSIQQSEQSDVVAQRSSSPKRLTSPELEQLFVTAREAAHGDYNFGTCETQKNKFLSAAPHEPHPASRIAADQYRTQDRHLAMSSKGETSILDQYRSLEEGENRLRKLTLLTHRHDKTPKSQFIGFDNDKLGRTVGPSKLNAGRPVTRMESFASSDMAENIANVSQRKERLTPFSHPSPSRSSSPAVRNDSFVHLGGSLQPVATTSLHAQSSNITNDPSSVAPPAPSSVATVVEKLESYPPQGELFNRPKGFEKWSKMYQEIVKDHEVQKERLRDLEAIIPTIEQIAKCGASDQFSARERGEVSLVQRFVRAVVDRNLSGRRMRKRFLDIQANMRRRLQKRAPGEVPRHTDLLDKLLRPERRSHIEQLISEVQGQVESLSIIRAEAGAKKFAGTEHDPNQNVKSNAKARKERKQLKLVDITSGEVNPSDLPAGTTIDLSTRSAKIRGIHSLTQRRRLAQYAAQDRKEDQIRGVLALFTHPNDEVSKNQSVDATNSQDNTGVDDAGDADNASTTSEEEEGAEFQSRPDPSLLKTPCIPPTGDGSPAESDTNNVEQQRQEARPRTPSRKQGNDTSLAAAMHRKEHQRSILKQHNTQQPSPDLLGLAIERAAREDIDSETQAASVANAEFDDLRSNRGSVEHDSDDEYNGEQVCYRYTLKSMYCGIPGYDDAVEYTWGHYLRLATACKDLEALKNQARSAYGHSQGLKHVPALVRHDERDERYDTIVDFGDDGQAYFRTWIEKEEHNPSKQAYEDARVKRACRAKPTYIALWERTKRTITRQDITDTESPDTTEGVRSHQPPPDHTAPPTDQVGPVATTNNEDDDDLFGPDPPFPAPPSNAAAPPQDPEETTWRITLDAMRLHTNIASANRLAREIFMRWFMDHLHGPQHHRVIAHEEELVERELESYGDRLMWEREDEFDVFDGEEESQGQVGDGISTTRTGYNDWFRVWVVKKEVCGPAN